MPFQFKFERPPSGVALTNALPGEKVTVAVREFTSTEDGQLFVQRLEGFVDEVLSRAPTQIRPSSVDHLLAVISRDGSTVVYVNELVPKPQTRVNRPFKAGELVYQNDVVDIERVDLGVPVPADAGVLFLFSLRWRKGLFFDFGPLGDEPQEQRAYDLEGLLGQYYALVLRQELFSLSETEWEQLLAAKWFPFAGIASDVVQELVNHLRAGWNPDDTLLPRIAAELKTRAPALLSAWAQHPCFSPHMTILSAAVDRFLADDHVSCTAAVFPRIEGLLRTHMQQQGDSVRPTASSMSRSSIEAKRDRDFSLLLPHRFEAYLRQVYFADFDPSSASIGISRHSVAHGVAGADQFTLKAAVLGLLVVHQLFYLFPSRVGSAGSEGIAPNPGIAAK